MVLGKLIVHQKAVLLPGGWGGTFKGYKPGGSPTKQTGRISDTATSGRGVADNTDLSLKVPVQMRDTDLR